MSSKEGMRKRVAYNGLVYDIREDVQQIHNLTHLGNIEEAKKYFCDIKQRITQQQVTYLEQMLAKHENIEHQF